MSAREAVTAGAGASAGGPGARPDGAGAASYGLTTGAHDAAAIPFYAAAPEWSALRGELLPAIEEVLASGRWLQGEAVAQLEAAIAARAGRRHGVAVGSGTDALFFALIALGVAPGDEVIVPALSFVATASAVVRAGARPVWADVDDDALIDLDSAAARVGPSTRAIVAVPLFGRPLAAPCVEAFARRHGLALVEDAAQAFGAARDGRPAGAVGAVSCLSFDPTKPLAAPGSGGMLLTDDAAIAERVRRLRWHGRAGGEHVELGYNSQLATLAAAALLAKLEHEPAWRARRQAIAAAYTDALELGPNPGAHRPADSTRVSLDGLVRAPALSPGEEHAFSKYVIRTPVRDALARALAGAGVPTLVHYPKPLREHPIFAPFALPDAAPNAAALASEVLSLPMHAFLGDAEVERVVAALRGSIHDHA